MSNVKSNVSASDLFWDSNACAEQIVWIAGQVSKQSDPFKEFCEDLDCVREVFFPHFESVDNDEMDAESIAVHLVHKKKVGFLVEVSAPVPHSIDANGITFHGMRQLKWFYTEDLSGMAKLAEAFASEVIEDERVKLASPQKS